MPRSARSLAGPWVLCLLMAACLTKDATEPRDQQIALFVRADVSATAVASVVVVVTAADITSPLVFNMLLANGVASGTIEIPAGSSRTITMHAYAANGIETHRGAVTVSIRSGTNPTIPLVLSSLTGDVPIDATLGSVGVTVGPAVATLPILATAELTATIVDANGVPVSQRVNWATRNPGIAIVTSTGDRTAQVTAVGPGSTDIEATFGGSAGSAEIVVSPPVATFPGAEGYGATTTAGRGGQVIHVTNLHDAGSGSLRAALSTQGPRTIIFDVSGQIDVLSTLCIGDPSNNDCNADPQGRWDHVTVAGQTAPSPGITLAITGPGDNNGLHIRAFDVLVQHIRIRANNSTGSGARRDCLFMDGDRIVVDHVTVTWAGPEGASGKNMLTGTSHVGLTISNSISAEAHIYGLLVQENNEISVIRTLFAHNLDRNPEIAVCNNDLMLNNVIYNPGEPGRVPFGIWGGHNPGAPIPGPNLSNFIGNVAIVGPVSDPGLTIWYTSELPVGSKAYIHDNILLSSPIIDAPVVQVGSPPYAFPSPLTTLASGAVEAYVLANVGARPVDRDAVDTRIISDVRNRTDNRGDTFPTLAQNARVLSVPANQATIRPSGYSVLEEDILFPLARAVEGRP